MTFEIPGSAITVKDLKTRMDAGTSPVILDVREPHEIQIAALPQTAKSLAIPLGELPTRISELEQFKTDEIVVYCRSGARSDMAANFLQQSGFKNVKNLTGGVLAWSQQVDQTVPQY